MCACGFRLGGYGKIGRLAEPVEALVREQLFAALNSADFDAVLRATANSEAQDQELLARLGADEAALAEAETATSPAAQSALMLSTRSRGEVLKCGGMEAGGLSWRRALLSAYIDRLILLPRVRGLNRFDPTRSRSSGATDRGLSQPAA